MRIFNLPRAAGKTTRMLYASEYEKAPILCRGLPDKGRLMDKAKDMGLDIPEPITVNELFARQRRVESGKILVDEALSILSFIIEYATYGESSVIGVTLSDEKNSQIIERL